MSVWFPASFSYPPQQNLASCSSITRNAGISLQFDGVHQTSSHTTPTQYRLHLPCLREKERIRILFTAAIISRCRWRFRAKTDVGIRLLANDRFSFQLWYVPFCRCHEHECLTNDLSINSRSLHRPAPDETASSEPVPEPRRFSAKGVSLTVHSIRDGQHASA